MTDLPLLRRKIGARAASGAAAAAARPDRVWRRAVAHGLTRSIGLAAEVTEVGMGPVAVSDIAAMVTEGALCALLDGPDGYGIAVLDAPLVSAALEIQTVGRVLRRASEPRAVTATDAALMADPLDRILTAQETLAAELRITGLATGYRFATRLADPRDVALHLPDAPLDRVTLDLDIDAGSRSGRLVVVMPRPAPRSLDGPLADDADPAAPTWQQKLEARVLQSEVPLRAELGQVSIAVHEIAGFEVGTIIPIRREALTSVRLTTPDGTEMGRGRLGQSMGRKAIRIESAEEAEAAFADPDIPRHATA